MSILENTLKEMSSHSFSDFDHSVLSQPSLNCSDIPTVQVANELDRQRRKGQDLGHFWLVYTRMLGHLQLSAR